MDEPSADKLELEALAIWAAWRSMAFARRCEADSLASSTGAATGRWAGIAVLFAAAASSVSAAVAGIIGCERRVERAGAESLSASEALAPGAGSLSRNCTNRSPLTE